MSTVYDSHIHNENLVLNIFHECGIKQGDIKEAAFKIAEEIKIATSQE